MERKLLLLGILLQGKMHGYQLNEYVAHAMSLYADLKKPTTYYELEKLEKDGYIKYEVERVGKRPERRVYEITKSGRAHFLDLLRMHLSNFTRTYYGDDIGIAFMDQIPIAESRELVAEKREKIQDLLRKFRELPEHDGNWHYVIRHNIVHLEADLAWLDDMLSELGNQKA